MDLLPSEGEVKESILWWIAVNVARLVVYLVIASFAAAPFLVLTDPTSDRELADVIGTGFLLIWVGGLGCLIGTVVWLTIVSRLSPEAPPRRRRTIAILTGPVTIGVAWIALFVTLGGVSGYVFALIFGSPAGWGGTRRQTQGVLPHRAGRSRVLASPTPRTACNRGTRRSGIGEVGRIIASASGAGIGRKMKIRCLG